MTSAKGKEKVTDGGKGKRKWSGTGGGDNDKTGQKRKNRGVLQFFDDRAYEVGEEEDDSSDESMFDDDFDEDEFATEGEVKNEPGKAPQYPCFPKEEEMSEEELERMLEERYKTGSTLVTYAEDGYEHKRSIDREIYVPSAKDPTIWKVKCMVGREKHSAFCLMQKYVDLNYLGTKLQIISAFALDHVKGFIYIEADKQYDINEACKGLCTVYSSRVAPVPPNEIHHLLSVRSKSNPISEGMWARVKNGKYKGDLAQVAAVNDTRKKVTVKLIPRIDLRAMAEKFGGGVPAKRTAIPAPRLISSSELEEFRPLIQYRRDRDTNQMFEILDGMLLKDGYLYKKVSIDSLSLWGVMPTDDELLKFEPSKNDESHDGQWLSQLFGEKKKKHVQAIKKDKGGGKEGGKEGGSCSSTMENNFEMHDLVFFGRKDFGVVIGTEKDDGVKVIREGSEGPSVVTIKQRDLKSASFDKKLFTVLDQHAKTISINDIVRVLDGPLKDRQGTVKKIYKGILFLCDGSEQENSGYICVKSQLCEKVNISGDGSKEEKGSELSGPSGFEDFPSSPKCPLSPNNSWQERDNKNNSNREDNGMFSVGQLLRIRLGPLKGYLCRVLAVRRSEVTVKLDSQHKILTVKCEHLSEVRGRNSAISQGEDSGSVKPFNFLGTQDGSTDWMDGAALSTDGEKWNAGGLSTERTSWPAFPSSLTLNTESGLVGPSNPVDDDAGKGTEGSAWEIKSTPNQNSSWGAAAADEKMVANTGSIGSWGTSRDDTCGSKEAWNKTGASSENESGGWGNAVGKLDKPEASAWNKDTGANTWKDAATAANAGQNENWGNIKKDGVVAGWGKGGSSSDKAVESQPEGTKENLEQSWGKAGSGGQTDSWSKPKPVGADGGSSWHKQDSKSWDNQDTSSWRKQDGGSSWSKQDGGSNGNKQEGESSWGNGGGGGAWSKQDGRLSWNKNDGESSWSKQPGESSWSQKPGGSVEDQTKGRIDLKDSWENSKGGFGGWKNDGMGNRDADQEGSWGRDKSFDGGHGNRSSWSSGQAGSWDKDMSADGGKKDGWDKNIVSGEEKESGWKKEWHANKETGESGDKLDSAKPGWDNKSSGWGSSKVSNDGQSSGWNKTSTANEDAGNDQGSWGKGKAPDDKNKSSWNTGNTSNENQASDWGQNSNGDSQKPSEKNTSGWNSMSVYSEKDGSSSTGWGQSNWSRRVTDDTGGNQDSAWSSKSNWNSGNGFGGNDGQNDTGTGRGRSGSWRGGREGRGDRGGFRDRGRSDRGGYGGRGMGRGGFGGRDGPDREGGFRGRGRGFRGRGRSDWNNRNDSGDDKTYDWKKGSNDNSDGWKNSSGGGSSFQGGSWSSGWNQSKGDADGAGNSQAGGWNKSSDANSEGWKSRSGGGSSSQGGSWSSGWNQSKGDADGGGNTQAGGWNNSSDAKIDSGQSGAGGSDWKTSNASTGDVSTGWGQPSGKRDTAGWNKETASGNQNTSGKWKSDATDGGPSKESNNVEGPVNSWGKAAGSSWGSARGDENSFANQDKSEATDGWKTKESNKGEGSSGSWAKAGTSSWGNGESK
ncbi:protein RNA-directed DNA methylation 3 [Forsythia ovata]|uniref:Protein RNA-directed DNA methylation 3 n=1 Tax=Forsythia ovata TaxID=205694 RepID=A0ABD1WGT0_9LAMI